MASSLPAAPTAPSSPTCSGPLEIEPTPAAIEQLRDAYLERLAEEIRKPMPDVGVLPGVAPVLDALDAQPDTGVGLLTGNFERGAAIKLGHFGLWTRFAFGAFGDLHVDRRELVPLAIDRAERATGVRVPAARVMVIGDTPLDIDCARAHGAVSVAVATGPFTRRHLASARPDVLLETLDEVDASARGSRGALIWRKPVGVEPTHPVHTGCGRF